MEGVHDVVKNELAGGVMPCKYFGANAAWLRLAVISHNVMTALKRLALPAELLTARPKRLRFLIFNTPGRLVHHARRTGAAVGDYCATDHGMAGSGETAAGGRVSCWVSLHFLAYRRICTPFFKSQSPCLALARSNTFKEYLLSRWL